MSDMIESRTIHKVTAETVLSLTDGTFVEPALVEKWILAKLETGKFPAYNMAGASDYEGLGQALEQQAEEAIATGLTDGGSYISVALQGTRKAGEFTTMTLTSPSGEFESVTTARHALSVEHTRHAKASLVIAARMSQAAVNLEIYKDRQQDLTAAQRAVHEAEGLL